MTSNIKSISAIVITKNEEKNISACLKSLDFCSEVVVFDSGSSDSTVSLCEGFANIKVCQTPWLGYSDTKQKAAWAAQNDWILWIDADEVVSENLRREILALDFEQNYNSQKTVMYGFPRKTFVGDLWISKGGWYPGIVNRLFHRKKVIFDGKVLHEGLVIKEELATFHTLKSDLLHYSYKDMADYFSKMVKYASVGAEEAMRKGKTGNFSSIALEPLFSLVKFYFLKRGFEMGLAGVVFALGTAASTFFRYGSLWWMQRQMKHKNSKGHRDSVP